MADTAATPVCPFCGAAWTAAMLDAFDRHSRGVACKCCAVLPGLGLEEEQSVERPTRDLCCETCGKPIYRAGAA